jgi:carboxyl-terminal processing protease
MNPKLRLAIAVLSTGLIFYIALGSFLGRVLGDTTYGQLALFNEVVRIVLDSYLEPVNLDRAMAGANLGLGDALDGDSAYLDDAEYRAYESAMNEPGDIGLAVARRFSFLIVSAVRPGSPADKSRIRVGDVIKTIDGKHSRLLSVPVAEGLMRGAPGSVIKLKLLRARSEVEDFELVRERLLPLTTESRMLEGTIGYLKIPEFAPGTAEDVETSLQSLARGGATGLALDLRGSSHGEPEHAVKVAQLFLKDGVITRLVSRRSGERSFAADGSARFTLPVAVLVDSSTGGPGEVLAAALSEGTKAPLVGERTFGRAAVQKTIEMAEGALVLTVAKYVSPKGQEIHGKGLEPSVPVQAAEEADEEDAAAEAAAPQPDTILEKAIEILKAEPARRAA